MDILSASNDSECGGKMLWEGVHKHIPFVIWNDFLCFVVGEKSLVLHVDFLDEICAVVFGSTFSVATASSSLRLQPEQIYVA